MGELELDVIAALQHEKRITVHDVKNLRAVLANGQTLYRRRGDPRNLEEAVEWGIARADTVLGRLDPGGHGGTH